MARIPRDVVDAVRDRTDLVELVSRHVKLTRRGNGYVGLCPFHQEKSPSFNVIPTKGIFHCFGCNAGGDAFKFLMTIEGLSFLEAVKELAGPAGITIEERELTRAERQALERRSSLYDLLEAAAAFYESSLWTRPEGARARAYLEQRAMTKETARAARMGYAPEGWSKLLDHLHGLGFEASRVHEAGLARERKPQEGRPGHPGYYDTLRDRVIFPIRDERGRVIAFGGRLMEGDGPKYINTPETRLYEKSKVLYGLDQARQSIQRRDRVVVVEGYFDVLSMHQGGFGETVATCGTALTPDHLEKIRRLTRNVVLLMDADEAGQRAAERTLPLFLDAGLQPWRLEIPGAKDPDELLRTEGPAVLEAAIDRREPLVEWLVRRKLEAFGRRGSAAAVDALTPERVVEELGPLLARLPDTLVSRVAATLHLHEESLRKRLAAMPKPSDPGAPQPPPPEPPGWRPHRDIVHLLWLIVHRYDHVADLVAQADPTLLEGHGPIRPVVARLLSGEPVAAVLEDTKDPAVARTLSAVVARERLYTEEEAPLAACEVVERLGRPLREARKDELKREQQRALASSDFEAHRSAASALQALRDDEIRLTKAISAKDVRGCAPLLARSAGRGVSRDIT